MKSFHSILQEAHCGDSAATEELVLRFYPVLQAFVRLKAGVDLKGKESVSDLVQTVCRQFISDLSSFRGQDEASFRAWLFTLATRKLQNRRRYWNAGKREIRRERRLGPVTEEETIQSLYATMLTPSQHAIAKEQNKRLEAAFAKLTPEQQEVILLVCLGGLSHDAVAKKMGKSPEACRALLNRARARLATVLAVAD